MESLETQDSIVHETKVVRGLVGYKFLDICPVPHSLFCIVPRSLFESNAGQIFLCCLIPQYFLANQTYLKTCKCSILFSFKLCKFTTCQGKI